jgi:hypothetical protein
MRQLVIFLEEPSAKEMLAGLLPRILPQEIWVTYVVFEGKSDLEKQLERRLKGWLAPCTSFLVLRDQDAAPCRQVKERLMTICKKSGRRDVLVRIACRELESFYFGDLAAVADALNLPGLLRHNNTGKYRIPDEIERPSDELWRITSGNYQKLAGSRAIGRFLHPERNTSSSFLHLVSGIQRLASLQGQDDMAS